MIKLLKHVNQKIKPCIIFIFVILNLKAFSLTDIKHNKNLKFFSVDVHLSVILDIKTIFESLGHSVENHYVSGATWVIDRKFEPLAPITDSNWNKLTPELVEEFYNQHKDYLNQFDVFIVTHSAIFSLLYEKFDKPIIFVNSTRYDNEFITDPEKLDWLNKYLQDGVRKNRIFIVSNNKADRAYLKYFTGLDSELIPSLCSYTKDRYTGKNSGFIIKSKLNLPWNNIFKTSSLIATLEQKFTWQELYNQQGIVHLPYNISTMSIFEQYTANVPLFFPTKNFLIELHQQYPKQILSELSFYQVLNIPTPNAKDNPNNTDNPKVIRQWIELADFYDLDNMPYIQYFNSFEDLGNKLKLVNLEEISKKMSKHNQKRKQIIIDKWSLIIDKINNLK